MIYIYLLLHPITHLPIYVGQSVDPARRYREHAKDKRKHRLWMRPKMIVVGVYDSRSAVDHAENVWVDTLIRWKFRLENRALTRPDTRRRPFFWLWPMLRMLWTKKAPHL
jgi:predicted GIY-YIG superfamily endonuclease